MGVSAPGHFGPRRFGIHVVVSVLNVSATGQSAPGHFGPKTFWPHAGHFSQSQRRPHLVVSDTVHANFAKQSNIANKCTWPGYKAVL